MSVHLKEREGGLLRCPYCHDMLVADEAPARCGACQAIHHATCASELGHCASCSAELQVAELPLSDRRCSFFHDCGTNAVQGDSLCHDHRRRVNASVPRPDLAGMHREALELAGTLQNLSSWLNWGAFLVVLPLAVVLASKLGLGKPQSLVLILLPVLAALAAMSLGDALRRKARRLRTLLNAIPDAVLDRPAIRVEPNSPDPKAEEPA